VNGDTRKRIAGAVRKLYPKAFMRYDDDGVAVSEEMAEATVGALLDDDLIEILDGRLEDQGFDPAKGGIKIVVGYLREGWSVVALPPEMADQFDGVPGVGWSGAKLLSELRRRLAGGPILYPEMATELLEMIESEYLPRYKPDADGEAALTALRSIASNKEG
jgi:hypothetical protein